MTSDASKTPSAPAEGGGMLPALLAGAGILAVAALFIFGGDDEKKDAKQQTKDAQAQASASAQANAQPDGGVAARGAADASQGSSRPKPRLNPRIANAVVTEGMSPEPRKPEPTSWGSVEEEIAYWEGELIEANRMLEIRQRAADRIPGEEESIRQNGTPQDLDEFQNRKQVVTDNLERAKSRVEEVEVKLEKLRG
jgi:hypothetical protein